MKALLQLKEQLGAFSIRASECSCCEMDHCHPETGEELLCDRKLVFQTLKRWFPDETTPEGHLDKFDVMVRTQLSGFVREILGSGAPHLRFVLANTAPPLLGIFCHYVHMAVTDPFDWTALGWMIGWLQVPPLVLLSFWEMLLCWRIGARCHGRVLCGSSFRFACASASPSTTCFGFNMQ
ncbi:slc38a6 [Symbiodinium natans]|uniref:Slc38a6 protein n=1 Tax=Symbiodinium natans TaxID=878477 RepID=A0A812V1J3_9DINO|nr:slc38a6 [Symbiodinium natans]